MGEAVTVALDWTPNSNHAGLYVAKAKGFFGPLKINFLSPHEDDYKTTPSSRVANKTATFSIAPSESVISYNMPDGSDRPNLKAIACILQKDTSAIVTTKASGLHRPQLLDGKKYASYGARFEGRIVQQMITNDGGSGEYIESTPAMLGIWNTLLKGDADATWVFLGWEGVEAQRKGVELNIFKLEDYGVSYGYTPVLLAHPDTLSEQPEMVRQFLAGAAQGYQYAAVHPQEAADLMVDLVEQDTQAKPLPTPLDRELVRASLQWLSSQGVMLNSEGKWGVMEETRWASFLKWLSDNGLLTTMQQSRKPIAGKSTSLDALRAGEVGEPVPLEKMPANALFTNEYLQ